MTDLLNFINKISDKEVTKDTKIFEDGFINSLTILDLIGYIEKRSGKKLELENIEFSDFATPKLIYEKFLVA